MDILVNFIKNNMKKIKIILLSVLVFIICITVYFYFFLPVPNFHSLDLKKKIEQDDLIIKWVDVIGVLDQDFPDYISIQKGEQKDTICQSHNIADLRMREDTIIIGFYGTPESYTEPITIPKEMLGYKIEIDTSFVKNE